MNGADIDSMADATFGAIAARAARYPIMVKGSQLRLIRKEPAGPAHTDPGIQWLLLNTRATNRLLKGTG